MELKKGFKKTEIGNIPNDWSVLKMETIGKSIIGLTYSPRNVSEYGILVHRSSNIQGNKLAYDDNVFVDINVDEKLILKENDILICVRNGSRDLIGKSALITGKAVGETFGAFMSVFRTDLYAPFVYQLFISNIIQKQINESLGATINQITNKTINDFLIPLPPTKTEQTAIATALSDMDNLIAGLQKLIEKKKANKHGAMQELLRPKEGWVVKKLGDLGECIIGLTYKPEDVKESGFLVLRSSNIQEDALCFNDNVYVDVNVSEKLITQENDILICVRNGSRDLIGKCALIVGEAVGETFGAFMSIFRSPYNMYLINCFRSDIVKRQIDEHLGATINQITNKSLNSFEVPFPTLEEQNEIVSKLSEMDLEIEKQNHKLSKYKLLKQGMMQELLTGKTRLV